MLTKDEARKIADYLRLQFPWLEDADVESGKVEYPDSGADVIEQLSHVYGTLREHDPHVSIETPAEPKTPFDLCTCGHARNRHTGPHPTPFGWSGWSGEHCYACENVTNKQAPICQRFALGEHKTGQSSRLTLPEAVALVDLATLALARAVANLKEVSR